jgi:hypothetical protein
MAYTVEDCIWKPRSSFHGSRTFRIKSSASSLTRRAEATALDPGCIRGQAREMCDVQLMVPSSLHSVDDKLRQLFNKAVMELEVAQQLTFRQERRIANFAPTDSATKVTHFIRFPSVLVEHVMYNLVGVLEIYKTTSGPNPAVLHGAKVIEQVLSVFNMPQPFILPLERPSVGHALLVRATETPCLGMLGTYMTMQITDISKWSLE